MTWPNLGMRPEKQNAGPGPDTPTSQLGGQHRVRPMYLSVGHKALPLLYDVNVIKKLVEKLFAGSYNKDVSYTQNYLA